MRKFLITLLLCFPIAMFGQVKVVQINSSWNRSNDLKLNLKNCEYEYVLLEDLTDNLKSQIKSVPFLYIIKNGNVVRQYQGGIRLRLCVTEEELQAYINSIQ